MRLVSLLVTLGWLLAGGAARAACAVEVKPVAFGVIDLMRQSHGRGEVKVGCDAPATFSVALSGGEAAGRQMRGPGGARLFYRLFTDATYTRDWGDGTSFGNPVEAATDGTGAVRLQIYGIVPAQPGLAPGTYSDSLSVILVF
jgi:spore coat protein U-like protein